MTSHETTQPPVLLEYGSLLEVDIDDADGGLFVLDRELGGPLALPFSTRMDPSVAGVVTVDGELVNHVLKPVAFGETNAWMLSVKVFGRLVGYGTDHALHVEGFADVDGTVMAPQDLTIRTRPREEPRPGFAEHDGIARRVAEEGIVLLENRDDTLPLPAGQLNVFGHAVNAFRTSVAGAGKFNARYVVGLREAIHAHERFSLNEELAAFYRNGTDAVPADDVIARARSVSPVGLVVLTRASGENTDNGSGPGEFRLTDDEDRLIEAVAASFERTVVLLNTPYPIDVGFVARHGVDALVLAGVGGMLAGPALLGVLDGSVNPSGRLPDTWARAYEEIPASRNFYDCADGGPRYPGDAEVWIDTVYEEGIYVGYRYFSTFGVDVAYPFGHGLSYTTFEIASHSLVAPALASDGTLGPLRVGATVRNTGGVAGREVVQVYVSKPDEAMEQPALELADFAKTRPLAPGDEQDFGFAITADALASWDEETAAYVAVAGEYVVRVGRSCADTTEAGRFTLDDPVIVRRAAHRMVPVEPVTVLSQRDPEATFPRGERSGVKAGATGFTPARPVLVPVAHAPESDGEPVSFAQVQADLSRAAAFVRGLSAGELARLVVCGQDGWGVEGTGVAGILAELAGRDLPVFQVADGNSGVHVRTPNIGMPTTVVLAATFDRDLARELGRVIGEEARAFDVNVILAPALNLHRNPLNGRHPEYFSEDPLLAGVLAGSYAQGLESVGVGACYKHVVANNAESARKRNQSIVPERALRELYLRAFEIALRTHPAKTIMTAYNAVNGVHTAADPELIQGFFRGELGFTGVVMTDWSSYDTCDVVDMMLAGITWITPGGKDDTYLRPIIEAVASGKLPLALLRENVTYLVRTVAQLARGRG
jgi:beta-glucosidase